MAGMPSLHSDHCDSSLRRFNLGRTKGCAYQPCACGCFRRSRRGRRERNGLCAPLHGRFAAVYCSLVRRNDCTVHPCGRSIGTAAVALVNDVSVASRRRESVTGGQFAPNSWLEAYITALPTSWSRNMSTKHLLTISLLLPLVAISATARAGSTITDKSYWPNEARQSAPIRTGSQADVNSAFAYDRAMSRVEPGTINGGGPAPHYQGGPKGR